MRQKLRDRFLAGIMAVMLSLFLGAGMTAFPVRAASGNIYSCKITPCYAHPVTGVIEDSGGQASYATGQGMVEGAVYTTGMMEVTDSGEYYLTIRMSLVDYTSNHSFTVQNVGDSGWMSTSMGVTGTGTDTNGTTADVCIQVPSENCIVRGSMYVTPMGRNVIFYLYPSSYAAGTVDGMNATMVTQASADTVQNTSDDEQSNVTYEQETAEYAEETEAAASPGSTQASPESAQASSGSTQASLESAQASSGSAPVLESSLSGTVQVQDSVSDGSAELNGTRGLSLSTEREQTGQGAEDADTDAGSQVVVLTTAITISGLILLAAAALTVYYFRRNWNRWGGTDDEDDE